LLRALTLDQNE